MRDARAGLFAGLMRCVLMICGFGSGGRRILMGEERCPPAFVARCFGSVEEVPGLIGFDGMARAQVFWSGVNGLLIYLCFDELVLGDTGAKRPP